MSLIIEPLLGSWDRIWTAPAPTLPLNAREIQELNLERVTLGLSNSSFENALRLSAWPRELKKLFPKTKITLLVQEHAKWILKNNPWIEGWTYDFHSAIDPLGISLNIEQSLPDIHYSSKDYNWAQKLLEAAELPKNKQKPLILIYPWGGLTLPVENWDNLIRLNSDKYRFWQIGFVGDSCVQGCEYYNLVQPFPRYFYRLGTFFKFASGFIGPDSFGKELSRFFKIPSKIVPLHVHDFSSYDLSSLCS